jgi:hypothetical protein
MPPPVGIHLQPSFEDKIAGFSMANLKKKSPTNGDQQ